MPETRRPEAELTDGRLRVRAAAADRVHAHAPAFVDPAMRARHQAADTAERDAVHAEAQGRYDQAALLRAQAAAHRTAADELAQIAEERAAYLLHHAETLTTGAAAHEELIRRGFTPGTETDRTTADEWLIAEAHARIADDAHRPIAQADLTSEQAAEGEAPSTADIGHQEVWGVAELVIIDQLAPMNARLLEAATEAEIHAALAHAAAEQVCRAEAQSHDASEPTGTAGSDSQSDHHWSQEASDGRETGEGARTLAEQDHASVRAATIEEAGRNTDAGDGLGTPTAFDEIDRGDALGL